MDKYAILNPKSGQLIMYAETPLEVSKVLSYDATLEVVELDNASSLEVYYTEMGGPWGYGHQEPSFVTYGPLKKVIARLYNWMKEEARFWGPDTRDIHDYFRHCSLHINGESKSEWFRKQVDKITRDYIIV